MNKKKISPAVIAGILFLVGFFVVFGFPFNAHAVTTSGYYVLTTIDRGYDTWTVDSVRLFVTGGWNTGNPDSAKWFAMAMVEPQTSTWPTQFDTLARYAVVTPGNLDPDYAPACYAIWFLDQGGTKLQRRDNTLQISDRVTYADTLRTNALLSATIDYALLGDSVDAQLSGTHGGGSWGSIQGTGIFSDSIRVLRRSDSSGIGAGAVVWLRPNNGGDNLASLTDPNGFAAFAVDGDTFLVFAWAVGFQQEITPDTNGVSSINTMDTVWMADISSIFIPPAGGDSCIVVVFTNDPGALAYVSIKESDHQDTSGVVLSPTVDVASADANGTIQILLPRSASTRQHSKWKIEVRDSYNKTMISVDDYVVPDQSIDTLLVEEEN
jgi:hypothetical protein